MKTPRLGWCKCKEEFSTPDPETGMCKNCGKQNKQELLRSIRYARVANR